MVRQLRGPGLATRLGSEGEENGPVRPLSDEEARRLDDECHERFIKVNVKHITDGQVSDTVNVCNVVKLHTSTCV